MTVPVLHIVGHSGSGKTCLIEKLLPLLTTQGLRVATLKHSHHSIEFDQKGKDSWRHKQAGAAMSVMVSAGQWMMVSDLAPSFQPQQWANQHAQTCDLVLVEGYHSTQGVKIEILRQAIASSLRCEASTLLAVLSDVADLKLTIPMLGLDNIEALADLVVIWLAKEKQHG